MSKMKTRRSAKLTEPTDGGGDGDTTMTSPTMSMSITVPLPSDFPIPQLQSILSLKSYDNLDAEDIISLYQVVLSQANDFEERTKEVEEARAELARKEVELDQVAHDSDSALNEARNEAENLQRELQSLRAERDSLGTCLSSLSGSASHFLNRNFSVFARYSSSPTLLPLGEPITFVRRSRNTTSTT
jgi:DNA-binding transcriptional MerR regulator